MAAMGCDADYYAQVQDVLRSAAGDELQLDAQELRCDADHYAQGQDVLRSAAGDALHELQLDAQELRLDGDYYAEVDDAVRSVSLGKLEGLTELQGWPEDDALDKVAPRFPVDSLAAALASEDDLGLSSFRSRARTSELGNALLDFFEASKGTSVEKVNRGKCSLKIQATSGQARCTLKVRIYTVSADERAVDVQRRSGDALAFQQIYAKLYHRFAQNAAPTAVSAIPASPPLEASLLGSDARSFAMSAVSGMFAMPLVQVPAC